MRYALSALLAAHGIAHGVGFAVSWRLLSSPELPFKTTLLSGRVDVGEAGIRLFGVLWLLVGVAMVVVAVGVALQTRWVGMTLLPVVVTSLVLCLLELPHARIGLALNGVLVLTLLLHPTLAAGPTMWRSASDDARGRLTASNHELTGTFTSASLATLPSPVVRYFQHVLTDGQPLLSGAAFTQTGQFRMGVAEDSWRPMQATQHFSVKSPGFVWDARINAYPLVPVFVRDSYVDGVGGMVASALGLMTVMNAPPSEDLSSGALQRYLGEAIWFPTALLPQSGVTWEPVDAHTARASLTDHGRTVTLEFTFNEDGDVTRIFTPSRLREVDGRFVATPWQVTCSSHASFDRPLPMRIPTYCEVSWLLDSGLFTYWKGKVEPTTSVQ